MRDVHLRYLDALERSGRLDRALELLPTADQLAERAESGRAHDARARRAAGLHQDLALRRAARLRRPRGPVPRPRAGPLLPGRPARPVRRPRSPSTRSAARSSRPGWRTRIVNPAGTTLHVPAGRGDRPGHRRHRARAQRRPGDLRAGRSCGPRSSRSTARSRQTLQIGLFLEVRRVVERASRWLLRNRSQPLDIAATVEFFVAGGPGAGRTAAGAADRRTPRRRWPSGGRPLGRRGVCRKQLARQAAALPATLGGPRHHPGRRRGAMSAGPRRGRALRAGRTAAARLAAPTDPGAAPGGPLAGARPRRAAGHLAHGARLARRRRARDRRAGYERPGPGTPLARADRAATSRCVRILDDIAGTGRADLATLTVALREIGALAQAGESA